MALDINRHIAQVRNRGDNWLAEALRKIQDSANQTAASAAAPATSSTTVSGGGSASAGLVSNTASGLCPKAPNNRGLFLRGDGGVWGAIPNKGQCYVNGA